MSEYKSKYLVKIDPENNTNRYYRMVLEGNFITVEMGRVGAEPYKERYPGRYWDRLYSRKIAEGYSDCTELYSVKKQKNYCLPDNELCADFLKFIIDCSTEAIQQNYNISFSEVSEDMVKNAQQLIYQLSECSYDIFNSILLELFAVIPRRMKDVKDMISKSINDCETIIDREQALLDVISTRAEENEVNNEANILDIMGIDLEPCSKEENNMIKKNMRQSEGHFVQAFRIKNRNNETAFLQYCKENDIAEENIHLYFHGTQNMNMYGICKKGLLLNPDAPVNGKMFGQGSYFADCVSKSMRYTSLAGSNNVHNGKVTDKGFLFMFKVAYKNPLHITRWRDEHKYLSAKRLTENDAVFAHAGVSLVHNEIITYDESQVTPAYVIEIS